MFTDVFSMLSIQCSLSIVSSSYKYFSLKVDDRSITLSMKRDFLNYMLAINGQQFVCNQKRIFVLCVLIWILLYFETKYDML